MQQLENIRWVSRITGLSVSTLYKMTAKNEIPVVRFGRKVMFRPQDIEEFVNGRHSTVEHTPAFLDHERMHKPRFDQYDRRVGDEGSETGSGIEDEDRYNTFNQG
jgi:excisionase family DNA binding protein